jgi:hypothetical protein
MMNRKTIIQGLALVFLATWAAWNFLRNPDAGRMDLSPYESAGTVAAEETSKLVRGRGEVVLVIPDAGATADPVMDSQVGAFRKALGVAGKARIRAVSTVKIDGFTAMRTGGAMPVERLGELLKMYRGVDAMVFFVGLPPCGPEVLGKPVIGNTRIVVLTAMFPWYGNLVRQGLIDVGMVSRSTVSAESGDKPGTTRAVFDREYEVLRSP